MKSSSLIRTATHAGSWYDSKASKLDKELSGYLAKAEYTVPADSKLRALIGPHAGYRYSGPSQAWAYKNLNAHAKDYDRVVLLGPSHKVYLDFAATTVCSEWETPLGNAIVDEEAVDRLCSDNPEKFKQIDTKYEEDEHSLEMHLPYIVKAFKDNNKEFKLIPIMVG